MDEIEKYIDNGLFIKWVYEPDDDLNAYWNLYQSNHPEEKNILLSLRKEMQSVRITNQGLTTVRKKELSNRIAGKIQGIRRVRQVKSIGRSLLKYAAIALLFIGIGGALSYLRPDRESLFEQVSYFDIPGMAGNPTLLLSDGSKIVLNSKYPEIRFISANQIKINNDSLIVLPEKNEIPDQLIIPYGCQGKIVLSDQSVVWLNAGSRLFFPSVFEEKEREVILFGEAFFEVKHNDNKPFIVKTANYRINVLGTKFNVSAYLGDDVSQTVLTEGSIELELENKRWFNTKIYLKPNELFSYDKETKEAGVHKIQPDKYVLWKDGIVKFEEEDLSNVIQKVERFYDIQIKLKDPTDKNIRFNGKLNLKNDKYEVLYYITKVANRKFIEKNERYFVIE